MSENSNIAILFFSRSASEEASHKYWDNQLHYSQKLKLSTVLIKKTLKTLSQTGLQVFHYDELLQRGNTFGEKIANAQEDIFQKGYTGIITVGNDCLELEKVNWGSLINSLSKGAVSIGPNFRNGAYLIAIPKELFEKDEFAKLDWQGASLLSQLSTLEGQVDVLSQLSDFNEVSDLNQLIIQRRISVQLINSLNKILSLTWIDPLELSSSEYKDNVTIRLRSLRAPPAA